MIIFQQSTFKQDTVQKQDTAQAKNVGKVKMNITTPTIKAMLDECSSPISKNKNAIEIGMWTAPFQAKWDVITAMLATALSISPRKDMRELYEKSIEQAGHNNLGPKLNIILGGIEKVKGSDNQYIAGVMDDFYRGSEGKLYQVHFTANPDNSITVTSFFEVKKK